MILSAVLLKMSRHGQELLIFCIVGVLALIGLVLLYTELLNVARARKRKREVLGFPDDKDNQFRKAG